MRSAARQVQQLRRTRASAKLPLLAEKETAGCSSRAVRRHRTEGLPHEERPVGPRRAAAGGEHIIDVGATSKQWQERGFFWPQRRLHEQRLTERRQPQRFVSEPATQEAERARPNQIAQCAQDEVRHGNRLVHQRKTDGSRVAGLETKLWRIEPHELRRSVSKLLPQDVCDRGA